MSRMGFPQCKLDVGVHKFVNRCQRIRSAELSIGFQWSKAQRRELLGILLS